MKECKGWVSDDGKCFGIKQDVINYEYKRGLYSEIDEELELYNIDDCEDLVEFLSRYEDTIRKIMGWEQIDF